jgi:hypothetical protein
MMRDEKVPRICLYHLVYTGRGREIAATDLNHDEERAALETIIAETRTCFDSGFPVEVLTVDNHCDGIALYLKMKAEGHPNADRALELLTLNGGNAIVEELRDICMYVVRNAGAGAIVNRIRREENDISHFPLEWATFFVEYLEPESLASALAAPATVEATS